MLNKSLKTLVFPVKNYEADANHLTLPLHRVYIQNVAVYAGTTRRC